MATSGDIQDPARSKAFTAPSPHCRYGCKWQMAKDEANRQHKLQQKAQDQFHKRLIFSDEHNLVSDRLKDEKMGRLLSTQESYSHSHLVSDPVLRIT